MNPILASSTVLCTILFSLVFGIASGYAVISMILHAFAHKPAVEKGPGDRGDCNHRFKPLNIYSPLITSTKGAGCKSQERPNSLFSWLFA